MREGVGTRERREEEAYLQDQRTEREDTSLMGRPVARELKFKVFKNVSFFCFAYQFFRLQ